jgi:cell division protein FtsZ
MVLQLIVEKPSHTEFAPRITVIGVGGGGSNAVNNMIALNLPGVDFVVANTDAQQLQLSRAEKRIQLGPHITQGNGAGGRPEIGKASADEAAEDLAQHLENTHMVFITAGMGGGTGTGAAGDRAHGEGSRDSHGRRGDETVRVRGQEAHAAGGRGDFGIAGVRGYADRDSESESVQGRE